MIKFLSAWTWEIIQTLLGFFLFLWYLIRGKALRNEIETYSGRVVIPIVSKIMPGVSLGYFIILNINFEKNWDRILYHEYGHCVQSMMLGPLYLFVVGIPSVINNVRARYNKKIAIDYYNRYPENWADKLGKVNR